MLKMNFLFVELSKLKIKKNSLFVKNEFHSETKAVINIS